MKNLNMKCEMCDNKFVKNKNFSKLYCVSEAQER